MAGSPVPFNPLPSTVKTRAILAGIGAYQLNSQRQLYAKAALLGAHATLEKRTPYWRGNYWTKRTLANRIHRETRLAGIGFGWTGERIGKGIRGHPFLYFSGGK
jgi:hypothetical protein